MTNVLGELGSVAGQLVRGALLVRQRVLAIGAAQASFNRLFGAAGFGAGLTTAGLAGSACG